MFLSKEVYWEIVFSIRILKINTANTAITLMIFIPNTFIFMIIASILVDWNLIFQNVCDLFLLIIDDRSIINDILILHDSFDS